MFRRNRSRTLLSLALVLLGVVALAWFGGRFGAPKNVRAAGDPVSESPPDVNSAVGNLAFPGGRTPDAQRAVHASSPPSGERVPKPGDDSRRPREVSLDTEGAAIVHVQLVDTDGQALALKGLEIELQSWLEDTTETFRHRLLTDERGRASMAFGGPVHVDWFKHEPRSGLPFLFDEYHVDIGEGEQWTGQLTVREAGSVTGRVVNTQGDPVAGVEVHLYRDFYLGVLDSTWRAGVTLAVTDQSGRFRFDSLAATDWKLAVPPFTWLQITPDLLEGEEGVSFIELEPGQDQDVGTIRVAPLERLEVRVVDLAGRPVSQANLWLEPLSLDVPGLSLPDLGEVDELERWLRGEKPWAQAPSSEAVWSYGAPTVTTDAQGRALFLATRGSWDLHVRSGRDVGSRPAFEESLRVSLPTPAIDISVAARLLPLAGRIVDPNGAPLRGVRVIAADSPRPGSPGLVTDSDEGGLFRFPEVPTGQPIWIHLVGNEVLPAVHSAQLDCDPTLPPTYIARPSASLSVRLDFPQGRVRVGWLRIRPLELRSLVPAPTQAEVHFKESLLEKPRRSSALSQGHNRLELKGLWPGSYEVAVMVPVGTGAFRPNNGAPLTESELWQRAVFDTDRPGQVFEIDLSSYVRPPNQPGVRWGGVVRNRETDKGVGRAWVHIEGRGWWRSTWTSNRGEFQLSCPDEPFQLEVTCDGYAYHQAALSAAGSLGHDVQVRLEPSRTAFSIRAQTSEGEDLPGARLTFFDVEGKPAQVSFGNRRHRRSSDWVYPNRPCIGRYLRPGAWQVEVECEGVFLGRHRFDLREPVEQAGLGNGEPELQDIAITLGLSADELRRAIQEER